MGDFQNYGPFLGPYYNTEPNLGDPKRDHNFDNLPYGHSKRIAEVPLKGSLLGCVTTAYCEALPASIKLLNLCWILAKQESVAACCLLG